MADNFNLRQFLTENKLTKNAQILKEGSDYGYEAVIDAIGDHFEEGTPEYDQVLAAVEDAFHNNEVDTLDFSHNPSAPSQVVLDIAAGLGLEEAKKEDTWEEGVEEEVINESLMGQVVDLLGVTNSQAEMILGVIGAMGLTGAGAVMSKLHDIALKGVFGPAVQAKAKKLGKLGKIAGDVTQQKEAIQETLTPREKKLIAIVENALGIQKEEYHDSDDLENNVSNDAAYEKAFDTMDESEMVDEKPLPKYENIEKLMQEIEAGTNEAAHSYKMKRMKEIAEMLEAKVGSLEEGEGADFVDAKKVKQMKKDIMTLRKQAEKLEKEYDKKFAKKEDKKEEK